MYIPKTTGGRIRLLREKNDLTRTALAKLVYVDRRTITRWENDEIFPRSKDIQRISEVFRVSCDYIIIGKLI